MAPSALSFFWVRGGGGGSRSGGGEGNRDSDGWYYLAVGNTLRHGDTRAPINVYRWDPDKKAFVFHHGAPVKFGGNDPKDPLTGTQFTCFTSTKVQILTQKLVQEYKY
jgi:hypothetical protein